MKTVSIHEAKTHLSKLIHQALNGEEIIIANRKEPMVRLEVVHKKVPARRLGGLKSLGLVMGPSFDKALEDFEGYSPSQPSKLTKRPAKLKA